ncbi:MAG: MFS transporter [Planctomycetes bacterium]|nr:MFS transporter [Planctomycetota bacterium]
MTTGRLTVGLYGRLSLMMFLQYAIWGAWLPLLWSFLSGYRGFDPAQIGTLFAVGAVGAIVAPFIAGQIADRYFRTEVFLGISHLIGALLVWQLATLEGYWSFLVFSLAYSLIYSPTLALTNSLAFHHLPDRDRHFGWVRVWGTVGWIAVGFGIGNWLAHEYTLTPEEATRRVAEERVLDAKERDRLLTFSRITLTEGREVVGRIVSEGDPLRLEVDGGSEAEEGPRNVEIPAREVVTVSPLYESIAKEDGAERLRRALERASASDLSDEERQSIVDGLSADPPFATAVLAGPREAEHARGMQDAFRLSAILGLVMGLFCFFLPRTPPAREEAGNATFEALGEVKRQPLLTLFLLAVPISCIHQFYFVHTAPFLGQFQSTFATRVNDIFGVGGIGLMTIGQAVEILVLAGIPFVAKKLSRKTLLATGIVAYAARMAIFAYHAPLSDATGIPSVVLLMIGVGLHGFCFGCFIFVAFMVVDEETTPDVRASAQSLFNLVIVGIGIIVGSMIAGKVAEWAKVRDELLGGEITDYTRLFSVPMWASVACLVALLVFYPGRSRPATREP